MSETTNTTDFLDIYRKAALFISPNIFQEIKTNYTRFIKDRQPERYIYEHHLKGVIPEATPSPALDIIITYCIYVALSRENVEQAVKTYRERRRVSKRNWIKSIQDEIKGKMTPKNPQCLRRYAEATYNTLRYTNPDAPGIEEIMQSKFEEIEKWRSDTSVPLTNYFFLSDKSVKIIATAFIDDLTFDSLTIIQNMFDGSLEGFNTKYPVDLTAYPIFNYRSSYMEFEPELLQNEILLHNNYEFETDTEDGMGEIEVQYKPGHSLPDNAKGKLTKKALKNMNLELRQKELDMKDREIMTQLFNLINGENINDEFVGCDLLDFTRRIFNIKVPRKKHYEDINQRLIKLSNYNYTITLKDKSGELIKTTTLSLISYIHVDFIEGTILFTPSEQLKRTYVQKKYINILSSSYKTIESAQTRSIMMILQQERLAGYKDNALSKIFALKYFRGHMKLLKMGNAMLVKELTTHLNILKAENIIVKDFEFINNDSSIRIDFMPLEEKEIVAYNFHSAQLLTSSVIDTDFVEIE